MAWSPISLAVPQYVDSNGTPYSGAVLKTYTAGTSTPVSMATDSTGGATVGSVALNASGYPAVSGNVVIPHVSANYKLSLYPTQAAADANSGALWTIDNLTPVASSVSLAASGGSALVGFLQSGTGAVATTVQTKNRQRLDLIDFLSDAKKTALTGVGAEVSSELANAITEAAGRPIILPVGYCHIESAVELNGQTGTGSYRPVSKLIGQGIERTFVYADAGDATFKHTLTQAQGDANSFTRGFEACHFTLYADGSSAAGSEGFEFQGSYNPWFHDILIRSLLGIGISTPADARWASSDQYSCASVVLDRVHIAGCSGWGIKNEAYATKYILNEPYIASNAGGGASLVGLNHLIYGGAFAGNGAAADAASMGLYFKRTSEGTPSNCIVTGGTEFDSNYNRQIRTNGSNGRISNIRLVDANPTNILAPTQIEVIALTGQSADSNIIEHNTFRFGATADNVTCIAFNLDSLDGRTVRYNIARRNTIPALSGGGVLTEVSFGSNPTSNESVGNKHFTNTSPEGSSYVGTFNRDIQTASGTQPITGVGFKPVGLEIMGFVAGSELVSHGYVGSDLGNRGMYYYPTTPTWGDTGSGKCLLFRPGAGDLYEGAVSSFDADGFTITWTRTNNPTGTATIKFRALKG